MAWTHIFRPNEYPAGYNIVKPTEDNLATLDCYSYGGTGGSGSFEKGFHANDHLINADAYLQKI